MARIKANFSVLVANVKNEGRVVLASDPVIVSFIVLVKEKVQKVLSVYENL